MCSLVIENCGILGELEISVLVNKVKMMSYIYPNCYITSRCMIKTPYFIPDFWYGWHSVCLFCRQFNAFLSGNLEFFSQSAGYRTRGSSIGIDSVTEGPRSNPAIVCYRQKAAGYLSSLASTAPDSVPHQVAVQNRQTLLSSAESKEGLSKQVCYILFRFARFCWKSLFVCDNECQHCNDMKYSM